MTIWTRVNPFAAGEESRPIITGNVGSTTVQAALLAALEDRDIIIDSTTESGASSLEINSVQPTSNAALNVIADTGHANGSRSRFKVENNAASEHVDINVRQSVLNVGNTDTGVDSDGTKILMQKPTGATSNYIEAYKAGSTTQTCFRVLNSGAVALSVGGIGSVALKINSSLDTQDRCQLDEFGAITWGPGGSTARDTKLERSAAGILKMTTGNAFQFPSLTTTQRDAIAAPANGMVLYNSTTDKLQVRAAGVWADLN